MEINKQKIFKASKVGARSAKDVITIILRIIMTVLLIAITTCAIFACIFVVYIKTNLTADLDLALEDFKLNQTSVVYYTNSAGNEVELVKLQGKEKRTWIDYSDIPQDFEHAVVAIEDKRFYEHHGVDWYRTVAAFMNMFLSMSDNFGGSTVTQQLIKNITEYDDVTVQRKLYEIFRALELEKNYTKDEIIEWYMNAVYFGHGCYGIVAAADYYYGKTVDELSLAEIASIVGITNNPSMYSPFIHEDNNKKRQGDILHEMLNQGYITQSEYDKAIAEELVFDTGDNDDDDNNSGAYYSYFVDALIEDVIKDMMVERNISKSTAESLLFNGGYKIYSTVNMKYQEIVENYYENEKNFTNSRGQVLQSSIVITDPYTGNVVALCGGVGEKDGNRVLNRATGTKRPPGSSFKPIATYGPAMDLGLITPETNFDDSPDVQLSGTNWLPQNDSRTYNGVVNIRTAVTSSLNTIAAQVMDKLTPTRSYEFLVDKLHFSTLVYARGEKTDIAYSPLALGQLTDGVYVREMAAAYSIFVNKGIYTEARTYTHIEDSEGNLVFENIPVTNVAISDVTAYWITDILRDAVSYGTGSGAKVSGVPTAGKTGTSGSSKDRWFTGYTPHYVASCWVGHDTPAKITWSGNPAAQTFRKIMTQIHEGLGSKKFYVPSNTYLAPVPGVDPEEEEEEEIEGEENTGTENPPVVTPPVVDPPVVEQPEVTPPVDTPETEE